jgi:5-methylcytosine-specific restriction protein A
MIGEREEFPKRVKLQAWQRCKGRCEGCGAILRPGHFTYDHRIPTAFGGPPTLDNCQVLGDCCNDPKTYQQDLPAIAKSTRILAAQAGIKPKKHKWPKRPFNRRYESNTKYVEASTGTTEDTGAGE